LDTGRTEIHIRNGCEADNNQFGRKFGSVAVVGPHADSDPSFTNLFGHSGEGDKRDLTRLDDLRSKGGGAAAASGVDRLDAKRALTGVAYLEGGGEWYLVADWSADPELDRFEDGMTFSW
jgi:hypothetical protein